MGMKLEYKHNYYAPQWTEINWPYDTPPRQAALNLAKELANDWADTSDNWEVSSILDDIEVRYNGIVLEF